MNYSEARAVSLGTQIAEMDMIPKFKQTQGWNTYLSFESRSEDARDHIRQWTSRLNTPPSLPLTISSRLTFEFPPLNFLASPSPTSISSPRKAFPPASGRPFRTSPVSAKPNEVLLPSRSFIPDFNLNEHHTDRHCHSKMSGSLGDQNRRGTGGDSRPNKERKFDLDSDERQRQRACDAYKLLENIQDVKNRGGPAFPPATEGQLHHVQAGFAQLNTHQDGFNLDGPTGQVNWIGAVSHVNNATWGSRVALNNPDVLAALCTTMQAIGARENATAKVAAAATAPQSTAAGYESSRRIICANCRHPGHKAALCPKPDAEFGAMFTCMVCNDARHHLDNCPDFAPNKEIFPRGFHGKSQQGGGQNHSQYPPSTHREACSPIQEVLLFGLAPPGANPRAPQQVLVETSQILSALDEFVLHPVGQSPVQSMGKGHQGRSHQDQGMGQRRPAPV